MRRISIAITLLLVLNCYSQTDSTVTFTNIAGKVLRSDRNQIIENAYILLMQEKERRVEAEHFDTRTDSEGKYQFANLPAGKYTVSIYSWFRNRPDVPCGDAGDSKTADEGRVTVEWQRKSEAFMEIVTIKGFAVEGDRETSKDFDIACR